MTPFPATSRGKLTDVQYLDGYRVELIEKG
jgi:hypothetical protein